MDGLRNTFQVACDQAGVILGKLVFLVHSIERNWLIMLVPERQAVLVNTYFVDTPIGLDGTDDLPVLSSAEFDQFDRRIPRVKEHIDFVAFGQEFAHLHQHLACQSIFVPIAPMRFG